MDVPGPPTTVKIIGDLVVVGGWTGRMNVWRVSEVMEGSTGPTHHRQTDHGIWSLASSGSDNVVSADTMVKFWRLVSHSMQEIRKPINLNNSRVRSIDMKDHMLAVGTFQKVEQPANSIVGSIFSVFLAGSVSDG